MPAHSLVLVGLIAAAHAVIGWHRLLAYLRYFQQETYDTRRFLRWLGLRPLSDPAVIAAGLAALLASRYPTASAVVVSVVAAVLAGLQPSPLRTGKIRLAMTSRATRVHYVASALSAVLWVVLASTLELDRVAAACAAAAITLVLLPFAIIGANSILAPIERSIQRGFERDAVATLRTVSPTVIGITGSYGKSSTKSILAHILQLHGPTLAATGSVNTVMGITRHIREQLMRGCQFLVVEMGAFRVGSIRRLCQLTPPSAGIITAVGDMHLERFGSLDAIVKAKGELAEALPPGGLLAINADSPGAVRIADASPHCTVLFYGETSTRTLDTRLADVQLTKAGTTFTLQCGDERFRCFTPLVGRPIILNIAGAFTLARALGVPATLAVAAIRTLRPVSNRLELVEDNGVTWIRDAYNSNQHGFRAALEVAAAIPASRRFLVTPGVIELADMQEAVNRALAKEAANICDTTVVVADVNRAAFIQGHADAGKPDSLVCVATRTEAFAWLKSNLRPNDVVVLENDLPDLQERSVGLFF